MGSLADCRVGDAQGSGRPITNKHKRRRAQLTDARSKSRGVAFFGRAVCLLIDQGTKGTPLRGPLLFFSVRMHRYVCVHAGGAYALV